MNVTALSGTASPHGGMMPELKTAWGGAVAQIMTAPFMTRPPPLGAARPGPANQATLHSGWMGEGLGPHNSTAKGCKAA